MVQDIYDLLFRVSGYLQVAATVERDRDLRLERRL